MEFVALHIPGYTDCREAPDLIVLMQRKILLKVESSEHVISNSEIIILTK